MPHHKPNSQWHINSEADNISLDVAISEFLEILNTLQKDGEVTLSQDNEHNIQPNKSVYKLIRYETHPRGDLGLKFEIKWFLENPDKTDATKPLKVIKKNTDK